ncbi:MAG: 5'/3'-nucleotidase SurE, partial [Proteobacteria bacterium]|nr:5'/3'-nucleotidase SurE [Pseudomonadota bacterium]
ALFAELLTKNVLEKGLPFGTFLNVNIPDLPLKKIEGVRICRQGTELYSEYIDKRIDPRNRTYYWQGCDLQTSINDLGTDDAFLCRNYISITPIKCDMTDYSVLEELKGWEINKKDCK